MQAASLPIIDLSPFLVDESNADARAATAKSIHEACLTYGFFYITGFDSVVSSYDMQASLAQVRDFFGRPEEEKALLKIRPGDRARGWQRMGQNITSSKVDHQEGLDFYRPASPEDPSKMFGGPNLFPAEPSLFKPTMECWISKMLVVGQALMEATRLGLGMDLEGDEWKEWKALIDASFWVMRCIGYPSLPFDAPGASCGAHKDYGCYTLLHADATQGALQVFLHSPDGPSEENGVRGTWINADPVPNSMVVNIGEMWEIWTNGLYRATLHRVIHKGPNYRVSIPFFYEPNFDALIKPLPSALAQQRDGEKQKEPMVYGDFLTEKVSNNFVFVED